MKALHYITFTLLAIGGLNWGLIGFFDLDLVALIFGAGSGASVAVYALVGLSALYEIFIHSKSCKKCSMKRKEKSSKSMDMDM